MDEAEFDKFADEYHSTLAISIASSGEGPEYFTEYKIRDILRKCELKSNAYKSIKILDFGSGISSSAQYVHKYFPNAQLTCLDVSRRSLEIAERRFPAFARYVYFDGLQIPFPNEYFDIAYAACVFHHIEQAQHVQLLQELNRVIRPGGSLFIFEHNPYNPLTVRVVNNCAFDENVRLIRGSAMKREMVKAGFANASIHYRVFFPHSLRVLRPLERLLEWLPLGGQYYSLARK